MTNQHILYKGPILNKRNPSGINKSRQYLLQPSTKKLRNAFVNSVAAGNRPKLTGSFRLFSL